MSAAPDTILAQNAGARLSHVCRATGTTVTLYDGNEANLDTDDGRWLTVCEQHGCIVAHKTYSLAKQWLSHPDEWCEVCMGNEPTP